MELNSYSSYSTETIASAHWVGKGYSERGTASADRHSNGWWISRVLVQPSTMTGKGVGGKLLEMVKMEIKKQGGGTVRVCPGGYDDNKKQQCNFYRKHGFVGDLEMKLEIPAG